MTDLSRPINQPGAPGQNTGHGHFPRPDRARARCGGPALCKLCRYDLARKGSPPPPVAPISDFVGTCDWGACGAEVGVKASFLLTALAAMESPLVAMHFHPRFVLLIPRAADGTVVEGYRQLVMHRVSKR